MKERTWTIGSLPDCDIQVDSPTVSGRHCRLTQRGDAFVLEDLASTNGTFVGGRRLEQPRQVRRGEKITLGQGTPMPWPNLCSITVGRLPDNDVVIPVVMVSGRHARVEREGSRVFLIDLKSTNGTSINDPLNKITRAPLQPGDVVFLGTHKITAADLLAALPADAPADRGAARQGTRIETAPPAAPALKQPPAAPKEPVPAPAAPLWHAFKSRRSWAVGIALSAVCILVVVVTSWAFRRPAGAVRPRRGRRPARSPVREGILPLVPADQRPDLLHRLDGMGRLARCDRLSDEQSAADRKRTEQGRRARRLHPGLRSVGDAPHREVLAAGGGRRSSCRSSAPKRPPKRPLSNCRPHAAFAPKPGERLTMLVAEPRTADDATTVSVRPIWLRFDQVRQDGNAARAVWRCTAAEEFPAAVAAPVLDEAGHVVGCVESIQKTEVRVVPLGRLATLIHPGP